MNKTNIALKFLMLASVLSLGACETGTPKYPTGYDRTETRGDIYAPRDVIWKNGSPIDKVLNEHRMKKDRIKYDVNQ
jgi:hypothetical protein